MKELTKAEEQIMQILWKMKKGFVKEIVEVLPEPKPAYNTVSTIVRILEEKGFVSHESFGRTHQYYPLITKKEYTKKFMKGFMKKYFENSAKKMFSFLSDDEELSVQEIEEIKKEMDKIIEKKKNEN